MSEMLGNQYFMARKYEDAEKQLEETLAKEPANKSIRKKLIICYTQTGQISRALQTFLSLIKEDIHFVIDTDPVEDDCPCPELVFDIEKSSENKPSELARTEVLGMLWLYCNPEKSAKYFRKALTFQTDTQYLKPIMLIIDKYLENVQLA